VQLVQVQVDQTQQFVPQETVHSEALRLGHQTPELLDLALVDHQELLDPQEATDLLLVLSDLREAQDHHLAL